MSKIQKIVRVRDNGVFRSFDWPKSLPLFARYNLIYGWNASGKTTLSRIFRALELKQQPPNGDVTLEIDGNEVRGDTFPQATFPIRVLNRDFIRESVFRLRVGNLPPIFVLGTESAEKQRTVEALKDQLAKAQAKVESERQRKNARETKLDGLCIERARVIKDTLRSSGSNPYNTYDKSTFRKRAEKMVVDGDRSSSLLSDSERERLLLQQRASPKPKVKTVSYQLPDVNVLSSAASGLLSETIVSRVIETLRDDPSLSSWVRQGLRLHRERHSECCLFCEQSLPKERLTTVEAHFSDEFEKFQKTLDDQIDKVKKMSDAAASLALPNRAEVYEDLAGDYEQTKTALRDATAEVGKFLDLVANKLLAKKSLTFESVPFDLAAPHVDGATVDRVNEIIQKHNQACDDFQQRVSDARRRLEADTVAEALGEFVKLSEDIENIERSVRNTEAEAARLKAEIERLEREIVQQRRPAEELNQDLLNYLGHDEIRLEVKETGYTITRNGTPAQTLCEGEITAIALLYFLKSLQDRSFDLHHGVVVLDDPVSSLDANALYLAFGYVRERTKDAGQLFVLTHNFIFFRQMRNWFHHLKGKDKGSGRFYMLTCARENNHRCATIQALDPLLEQYESEYHYLFSRVYEAAKDSSPATLDKCYEIPNMARRLLEAFLAFRHPEASGELWRRMGEVHFPEAKKLRILRFLHTYSHDDAITEPEHDSSLLREAPAILADLIDLIKSEDSAHFSAMKRLIAPEGDQEHQSDAGSSLIPEAAP